MFASDALCEFKAMEKDGVVEIRKDNTLIPKEELLAPIFAKYGK
ncbi:MAG: hypothetical protein QME61_03315 [Patescibacteria group bacterium]|nr:hypothetical protein [Patescibacteria group bacterium]